MQIPIDRYRILGVPHQATSDQIEQAFHDRCQQQPPPGFSSAALAARMAIVTAARETLTGADTRAAYDAELARMRTGLPRLGNVAPALPPTQFEGWLAAECKRRRTQPLEISPQHLAGAGILLFELGDYDLVQGMVHAYLQDRRIAADSQESASQESDFRLAAALAHRECGRELWQQHHYSRAAAEMEAASHLADTETFPGEVLRAIENDASRLRPYEIWEVLTSPERTAAVTRRRALALLQRMLDERGGLEGGTITRDRSGLSTDAFLNFMQQLRAYLSAEEQLRLFSAEAQRPSAAASYLLAYTQVARGFASFQPALIVEATAIFSDIARHHRQQDVAIERAICALLLGRTEEATATVESSRDREVLDFIRGVSPEAPDLLPGLCRFTDRWLHSEVLPKFQDLSHSQVTLKEYFAERQVQTALEGLAEAPQRERLVAAQKVRQLRRRQQRMAARAHAEAVALPVAVGQSAEIPYVDAQTQWGNGSAAVATAIPASAAVSNGGTAADGLVGIPGGRLPRADGPSRAPRETFVPFSPTAASRRSPARTPTLVPPNRTPWAWAAALVGAVGVAVVLGGALSHTRLEEDSFAPGEAALPVSMQDRLLVRLDRPLVDLSSGELATASAAASPAELAPATPIAAEDALAQWLVAKGRAYGVEHDIAALDTALTGTPLAQHRQWATELKQVGGYRQFEHEVTPGSARLVAENGDRATLEAIVREVAVDRAHQSNAHSAAFNYDSRLRVRYELVRAGADRPWKIAGIAVLERLP